MGEEGPSSRHHRDTAGAAGRCASWIFWLARETGAGVVERLECCDMRVYLAQLGGRLGRAQRHGIVLQQLGERAGRERAGWIERGEAAADACASQGDTGQMLFDMG